jgi:hypothetical protein
MPTNRPDDAVSAAIWKSLKATGIHSGFHVIVRQYVLSGRNPADDCCGGFCSPCMIEMQRTVDMVRELLNPPE